MKVCLYINKKGFKENTFRVAFKELIKLPNNKSYLVGKCETKDYNNSFDVPYNKKYENRYFAIPITDKEKGFFNFTTILCNNDLSDYEVLNEANLPTIIDTVLKLNETTADQSTCISMEYLGSRSLESQKIMQEIAASSFIAIINMLNTWSEEEKKDIEFKLQIEF